MGNESQQDFNELLEHNIERRVTRRTFMRLIGAGSGMTLMGGLLAACGGAPEPNERADISTAEGSPDSGNEASAIETPRGDIRRGGKLVFSIDTAPLGFDPHTESAFSSMMFYEHIYDSLFDFSVDLELVPALCESYEAVDERTYEFKVRQGVTFHDGSPMTVEDVKFSFDRMMDPESGSTRTAWYAVVDSVEIIDDSTVAFHLNEPFAPLISYMGMQGSAIVSKATVEENGDLRTVSNGTGPFILEEYQTDQFGRFRKFADHWRGDVPYLDELEIRIQPDEASRVAALRAGEVDMTRLFDVQNAQILNQEGFTVFEGLSTARAIGIINCTRAPFTDARVRLALSYAIDRQGFIDAAVFGRGEPTGPIPVSDTIWGLPGSEFQSFTQNVKQARELLAEAGYANGFNFTVLASPSYPIDISNAQVLQAQLQPLGIKVDIQQVEWGNLLDNLNNQRDFDMIHIIYTHSPDPDGYTWTYFHSGSPSNVVGVSDPDLDALLNEGRAMTNIEQRKEVYDEAQRKLVDELSPWLTYFVYYQYIPAQEYVQGYQPTPSLSRRYLRETWLDR